jgi:hypothetical protein
LGDDGGDDVAYGDVDGASSDASFYGDVGDV